MNKYLLAALVILFHIAIGEEEALELEPAGRPVKKGPCDDTRECIRYTFEDDARALCWGYYGCKGATFETSMNAICSGSRACLRAKFDGTQPAVKCNGHRSCVRARGNTAAGGLNAADAIYCNGFQTCTAVVGGLNAPAIYCDGDLACSNSRSAVSATAMKLYALTGSSDDMVYCNGHGACKENIIESDGEVYCDGDAACKDTRITTSDLKCHGKRSCYNAYIDVDQLDAFGWFAALNSTISTTSYIRAYGFNSLAMSRIFTRGEDLTIEAYGFRALAGAIIKITSGATVTLTCKNNACKGVPVYVVGSTSTLVIDPPECDPCDAGYLPAKKDGVEWGAKVEGTHCPWIIKSGRCPTTEGEEQDESEILTDEQIEDMIEQYLIDVQYTEEWEEMVDLMNLEESNWNKYIDARLSDYAEEPEDEDDWADFEEDEFFVSGSIMGVSSQQYSSGLLLSNLLTALAVFMMTSGLIYCIVSYKQQQFNYKAIPQ